MTLEAVSNLVTGSVDFNCNGLYFEGYYHYFRLFVQRTLVA